MARLGDATWHPKRVTLGKAIGPLERMAHNEPCVGKGIPWLTLSHVVDDVIIRI